MWFCEDAVSSQSVTDAFSVDVVGCIKRWSKKFEDNIKHSYTSKTELKVRITLLPANHGNGFTFPSKIFILKHS